MKTQRRLVSAVLALIMLLSPLGLGSSAAAAQAVTTVMTDSELAYDPLPQAASIAYEQHEDGYAVSLDRAEDSVTMNITAVPGDESSRAAEKARLYIRTGVSLKPNTAYRVSYSLVAEKAQPEYAVCFDGSAEAAYGALKGRGIEAGGVDHVKYEVTPEANNGELVLRLLLGKTGAAGNTLRFSNLAVEEISGSEIGQNVVLADRLNYNAPGFIRFWTNSDSGAVVTCDERSATLTVTKEPEEGAEVWKIKLFVATGLKPAAGKSYHFTADIDSTEARGFELCYNEGETEKGFGAEYSQRLLGREQKLDYIINIPKDKKNPGELIIQFSLGNLKTGDKVTLSNIYIEEASARYTRELPDNFSFADATEMAMVTPTLAVTGATDASASVNWSGTASVSKSGDNAGDLSIRGGSATLPVYNGTEVFLARLNIDTGVSLAADKTYRVSFNMQAYRDYLGIDGSKYEVLYGTGFNSNGIDNNGTYGGLYGGSLEANSPKPVNYVIKTTAEKSGPLLITLQLGATDDKYNEVTVSDLKIEEVRKGENPSDTNIAGVKYPSADGGSGSDFDWGSFSDRSDDEYKGIITGDGSYAEMTCKGGAANDIWVRGFFVKDICRIARGSTYKVSFDIEATEATDYQVALVNGREYGDRFVPEPDPKGNTSDNGHFTKEFTANDSGSLWLRIEFGKADTDTKVRVSGITVEELGGSQGGSGGGSSDVTNTLSYPELTPGSFYVRKDGDGGRDGVITGDGNSYAEMTCLGTPGATHYLGFFVKDVCNVTAGSTYQVSFDIEATEATDYQVALVKGEEYGDRFVPEPDPKGNTSDNGHFTKEFTANDSGSLWLRIEFGGAAEGEKVKISNIEVELTGSGGGSGGDSFSGATMKYPESNDEPSSEARDFKVRKDGRRNGTITGNGSSATMTCLGEASSAIYDLGFFVKNVCNVTKDSKYRVSFKITTDQDTGYQVAFLNNAEFDQYFGDGAPEYKNKNTWVDSSFSEEITVDKDGTLWLRIEFGGVGENATVTLSDIEVELVESGGGSGSGPQLTLRYPKLVPGSTFAVRKDGDGGRDGVITGDGNSYAEMTCLGTPGATHYLGFFVKDVCNVTAGSTYQVSFDIEATEATDYQVALVKDREYGDRFVPEPDPMGNTSDNGHFTKEFTANDAGSLWLRIEFGGAAKGEKVKISNIKVYEITEDEPGDGQEPPGGEESGGGSTLVSDVKYPNGTIDSSTSSGPSSGTGSFSMRAEDGHGGDISGGEGYATVTCTGGAGDFWQRGLFIDNICDITAGTAYQVSLKVTSANADVKYRVCVNDNGKDGDADHRYQDGYLNESDPEIWQTSQKTEITQTVTAKENGKLCLRVDFGEADTGTEITVSDIEVREYESVPVSTINISSFGSVWAEGIDGFRADLTRGADNAVLHVVKENSGAVPGNWKAKLFIRTGVSYEPDKAYQVKFDITAANAQKEFCVIFQDVPDSEDIRGTWGLSIGAGETKPITTRAITADKFTSENGELALRLELGNLDGVENTFTVSNVIVEEVDYNTRDEYLNDLFCGKNAAVLNIWKTPTAKLEPWKVKMFIHTNAFISEGEKYRVTFTACADNEMDFEVCYNRNDVEKGYGTIYGLHAEEDKDKRVEHVFTALKGGDLILQIMLGKVIAPNEVTISDLKVERIDYTYSGRSALPKEIEYRTPSAVSYWAHEDYTTTFTGTDNAITANIKAAPAKGAEPWKIKLFLDTGTPLQAGKYYKVTANVKARLPQDYEICYNNGGIEMGYDSLGGLRLTGGETQTVERIISVPAGKTGLNNLTLQFNLGKTNTANEITVSGIKVEETSLSYIDMMSKDFAYTAGKTVSLWTNPDYAASLEGSDGRAAVHITGVPATGAEVWKVKLLVNTGAILSAGRTYLVRADLSASKAQNYEVCFNNEETEKGFDALYNQSIAAGGKKTIAHNISVPASMTDAGELVLQFSVGGAVANDITVSNVSVQELNFGTGSGKLTSDTVINLYNAPQTAAGTLDITREKLTYRMTKISSAARDNAITISGADLRADDLYTVTFTARADKDLTGTFALGRANSTAAISAQFKLTPKETTYSFTTKERLSEGGAYDLLWQFGSADNQKAGSADVEISKISVYSPPEKLEIIRGKQNVMVNGKLVTPDTYNINGSNYIKLRDLALLLNDTDAQFVVRYNSAAKLISLTTGKPYTPVGGELTVGADRSASCVRSTAKVAVNGKTVNLKAYNIGNNNYFKLRDLDKLLGYKVEYVAANNAAAITSPLTPEAQEKAHAYDLFFLPEIDGASQPYVGDTMPFYDNGVYYIYYLKDGGDSYNHSVYLAATKDFVTYKEYDNPVLSASREDVQDNWIGTGSVVKVENTYYFFYTGYNASGSQEYHEKIMVAKGSSPTSFEKVSGWEIVPPASLGQKNDFRDPQAYYDPASKTISLTVTASQDGAARILKYTLGRDLQNVKYDGIIFTDPTGEFWNLECSDTFQIGNKWYLTYSGQEDTLWYAMSDSRFGPYTNAARLEGKLFYAAKHVEDGNNSYMVGWARRANSASSTEEVAGWAGNIAVQKLHQQADGSLALVPVDSIVASFDTQKDIALGTNQASLTAGSDYSYKEAFTSYESFKLSGEFTYSGTGSFGLAFDFNGKEEQYKLISLDPAANKLSLAFNEGATLITETQAALSANQTHSFTYIQDGSVGIFYLDNQAALLVRLYGVTDKPIYLFAENNSVTFTSLRQYTQ